MGGDAAMTRHPSDEMQSYETMRPMPRKATNWNNTTLTHVAGAPCSSPAIPSADVSLGPGSRFGETWSV
jgi:hypothetical protein